MVSGHCAPLPCLNSPETIIAACSDVRQPAGKRRRYKLRHDGPDPAPAASFSRTWPESSPYATYVHRLVFAHVGLQRKHSAQERLTDRLRLDIDLLISPLLEARSFGDPAAAARIKRRGSAPRCDSLTRLPTLHVIVRLNPTVIWSSWHSFLRGFQLL